MQLINNIKWALTKYKMRRYLKNKYKGKKMTRYKKELKYFRSLGMEQRQTKANRILAAFAWLDFVVVCKRDEWVKSQKRVAKGA